MPRARTSRLEEVKPAPFAYCRPGSLDEALLALASEPDAKVLAGGQSLVPLLSMRLASPSLLVDINGLLDLDAVTVTDRGATIGALARHAAVLADPEVRRVQPLIPAALACVAHATIRNRGTTLGSIVHADAAAEMPVVLSLLEGSVEVASVRGRRTIHASELFLGPLETSLAHDELALSAHFPALPPRTGIGFEEISRRHGDYALCGVASLVTRQDDRVLRARAGFVSVGDTPAVLDLTAAFAAGLDDDSLAAAGELALESLDPAADIHATAGYRAQLVRVLTARVLRAAYDDAGGADMTEELHRIRLSVNGVAHEIEVPARRLLSDALRHDVGLTGTHIGCEHGVCGACTVLFDGAPVRACLMFAVSAVDAEITTVEGLAGPDGTLSPVQRAFGECHGLQCGFCTPGFLTTVTAGLRDNPQPTHEEAREMVAGNLCRCTGYQNIVRSVERAAELIGEES